jgi:hypothetical protein
MRIRIHADAAGVDASLVILNEVEDLGGGLTAGPNPPDPSLGLRMTSGEARHQQRFRSSSEDQR